MNLGEIPVQLFIQAPAGRRGENGGAQRGWIVGREQADVIRHARRDLSQRVGAPCAAVRSDEGKELFHCGVGVRRAGEVRMQA